MDPKLERKIAEKRRLAEEGETWTVEPRKQSIAHPSPPPARYQEWENAPDASRSDYHAGRPDEGLGNQSDLPSVWENEPEDRMKHSCDATAGDALKDNSATRASEKLLPSGAVRERAANFSPASRTGPSGGSSKSSVNSNGLAVDVDEDSHPSSAAGGERVSGAAAKKFAEERGTAGGAVVTSIAAPGAADLLQAAAASTSQEGAQEVARSADEARSPEPVSSLKMTEAESLRHRVLTLEDCSRKLARRLAQTTEELCVCKATLDKHGISTITGDARREEQPSMFQTLWSDFSKSIASAFGLTEVTTAAATQGGRRRTREDQGGGRPSVDVDGEDEPPRDHGSAGARAARGPARSSPSGGARNIFASAGASLRDRFVGPRNTKSSNGASTASSPTTSPKGGPKSSPAPNKSPPAGQDVGEGSSSSSAAASGSCSEDDESYNGQTSSTSGRVWSSSQTTRFLKVSSPEFAMLEEERNRWIYDRTRCGTCNDALLQLNDLQGLLEIKQLECERLKLDKQELVAKSKTTLREEMRRYQARIRRAFVGSASHQPMGAMLGVGGGAAGAPDGTFISDHSAGGATPSSPSVVRTDYYHSSSASYHREQPRADSMPFVRRLEDNSNQRDNSQLLEDLHPVDARTPDRMSMSPRGGAGGDAAARHDEGRGANDGVAEFLAPTFSMQEYRMQDVISQIELIEQEEQKTLEDIFEGTDWERLMKCDPLTKEELAFRAEQNKRARTSSLALLEDKRLVEMLDLSPVIADSSARSSPSSRSKATAESGWPQELRDSATSLSFDGGTTSTVAEVVEGGGVGSAVKTEGASRSRTQHFQLEDPEEPGDGDTAEGKKKD